MTKEIKYHAAVSFAGSFLGVLLPAVYFSFWVGGLDADVKQLKTNDADKEQRIRTLEHSRPVNNDKPMEPIKFDYVAVLPGKQEYENDPSSGSPMPSD